MALRGFATDIESAGSQGYSTVCDGRHGDQREMSASSQSLRHDLYDYLCYYYDEAVIMRKKKR